MKDNNNKPLKQKAYKQMSIFDYIEQNNLLNNEEKFNMKTNNFNNKNKQMKNNSLICNICGHTFSKVSENDTGNNSDPIVKNWGCCGWCNDNIVVPARFDRNNYLKNETEEIIKLYKKADNLFTNKKFLKAITIYNKLTIKSKSKYWPYWAMYLTACEIAKIDNSWNDEVCRFYKCAVDLAPVFLQETFKKVNNTYKNGNKEIKSNEK